MGEEIKWNQEKNLRIGLRKIILDWIWVDPPDNFKEISETFVFYKIDEKQYKIPKEAIIKWLDTGE